MWFWLNERAGCWLGNHLIADHPEIKRHLATRVSASKIATIPYGAERIDEADPALIEPYGLVPGCYAMVVARPEPENSILEMVRAWSRKFRGCKLMVLGRYDPGNAYAQKVTAAASAEVIFPGAIYDKKVLTALRFFARVNLHGHRVGGTNPTLVEALGAGNPIIAHDNPFNRWVAGDLAARFFTDEAEFDSVLDELLPDLAELGHMRTAAYARHAACFTWQRVLRDYELLLLDWARASEHTLTAPGHQSHEAAAVMVPPSNSVGKDLPDPNENDEIRENARAG
ncbi:MAG: glycosyltransferase [Panacagrimonas sp.]